MAGFPVVSMALHALAIGVLIWPVRPGFVTPSSIRKGERGTSTELVSLSSHGLAEALHSPASEPEPRPIFAPASKTQRHKPKPAVLKKEDKEKPTEALTAPRAGAPYGSLLEGPLDGHEVRPAIPVVFPSPAVSRWDLPPGVVGDVVVEVTIDALGNVVETNVLQKIGYGIDDRVVAAVRTWRFRPATLDGVAIPSQHDVHFHFPS